MQIPILYTIGFISSVYIWKIIKRFFKMGNNAKLKTLTVAISVLLMILNQRYIIGNCSSIIQCLSINISMNSILYPLICNTFLFLGPIYNFILDKYLRNERLVDKFSQNPLRDDRMLIRIVLAPLLEEITFRVLFYQNFNNLNEYCLTSSILFSLAHSHKFFSFFKKERKYRTEYYRQSFQFQSFKRSFIKAFLRTLFVLMFTFIFGFYAASVFLKTKSLISVILLHSYCNYLGFPNLSLIFSNTKTNIIKILSVYFVGILFFYYFITI
ncbi:unnamed protein product [Paramecium sonneborni]|uniref:intramembrane prenyl-peptidase Rce1 n=1 Tax=Paramecium sonneborni TaxID=65129 RepID=A0A8S1LKK8_9CILI|nr:unnamed protein product [Paramecium sonneborni]